MNDDTRVYDLNEVATEFGMSTRWVRDHCKNGATHMRLGRKITFTRAQIEELKQRVTKKPAPQSITTGKKRSA